MFSFPLELEEDLSAAEQNTRDFTRRISRRIGQNTLKAACREFVKGRYHVRVT